MKTRIITTILAALLTAGTALTAQDYSKEYLGLPGDNLNLYAVMKVFQESKTLEAFEKSLNDPKNRINNLDLNGDNLVDYIMVFDNVEGDVHYISLRVAINRNENQDVAVFTVQQSSDGQAYVQLIGDEALYGKNYIIEPNYNDNYTSETPNPGYNGYYGGNVTVYRTSPVYIATWPIVRFIYRPNYIGWHSRWYWGYYPAYWNPWRPSYWDFYYGYHYNLYSDYYGHYRRWYTCRDTHWNDHYYVGHRAYSPVVYRNLHAGNYRNTYSHPEQRKEGEASYRNNHPDQGRRTTYSTSGSNNNNRNTNSTVNNSRPTGSVNSSRRVETPVSRNSGTEYRTMKGETTTRRMASENTRSIMSNGGSNRSTVSNAPASRSTVSNSPSNRNTVSQARTSPQASARPASKPEKSQNVSPGHSSGQSHSVSAAPSRRSSGSGSQVKSNNTQAKSGKTETSSSTRRK